MDRRGSLRPCPTARRSAPRTRVGAGSSALTREAVRAWTGAGVRAGGLGGATPHFYGELETMIVCAPMTPPTALVAWRTRQYGAVTPGTDPMKTCGAVWVAVISV